MSLDTDMADIEVKEANLDDVIGIVYVQATTWIAAYPSTENGISEADIRSIDFKSKVIDWQHVIRSPNYGVWVASKENKVVGFISVLKENAGAEVYEHCVLPDFQRRGLGVKLWQAASSWLGELPVRLRIISYNQAGVAFYKKHGFKVSTLGEVDFIALPSGKNIPTIEMRKGELTHQDATEKQTSAGQPTERPRAEPAAKSASPTTTATNRIPKDLLGRAELARISNVRASTIKYYTEVGLLPFEQAESRLARRYKRQPALQRLQEIQQLRQQGLSIKQITEQLQ